ncbi:TolC family protein [Ferruginibacter lapsinanis]|uniref:TolC family protein n=1 Tax=Ferruginibacter lapsinanis TaxID=563172 RepID=UPI001E36A5B3|nr:TolC family protein [Ferruginibacter lapsinanis]UEG49023.1 TolC family protein [Ferruginibacter lapsinanis]
MTLYRNLFLLIVTCICLNSFAQEQPTKTLNAEQLMDLVRNFHPVAKLAGINIDKSKADIITARAGFDPIVNTYIADKTFDGVNYYRDISPEIKIPTWYGIDILAGTEDLSGDRVDPTQSKGQSNYIGVNIPILKNLLIDKRRAFLQQAKIFNSLASVEQRAAINDLLLNALETYWQWVKTYQTYVVIKNNVATNQKRLELVRKSFFNGELAAIDTTEALAQLQNFQLMQNNAWLEFQNTGLQLSAYLWLKNNEPYQLPETIIPQDNWDNETAIANFNVSLPDLLATADKYHPELKKYVYKLDILNIDKKLKFQDLLPKLDFRYNHLGKGYNFANTISKASLFQNNYQYNVKFEIPIRLSEGRGNYKKAKLKIEETKLELGQKRRYIELKIKSYYNEFITLKEQVILQSKNYSNYQKMLEAEEIKFFNGESSLFLINSRENKSLEALEKLIVLKTKYYKSIYALQWSAGLLQ